MKYQQTKLFERLIAEVNAAVDHMTDEELERVAFIVWSAQQERFATANEEK